MLFVFSRKSIQGFGYDCKDYCGGFTHVKKVNSCGCLISLLYLKYKRNGRNQMQSVIMAIFPIFLACITQIIPRNPYMSIILFQTKLTCYNKPQQKIIKQCAHFTSSDKNVSNSLRHRPSHNNNKNNNNKMSYFLLPCFPQMKTKMTTPLQHQSNDRLNPPHPTMSLTSNRTQKITTPNTDDAHCDTFLKRDLSLLLFSQNLPRTYR